MIVLSNYADPSYAAGLLEGGTAAEGILLKERVARFDELADAVRQVAAVGPSSILSWWRRCSHSPAPRPR